MPTLRNSSPSAIPTELFQYILQDLPQYGLLNMCMLSRALHKEGVRVLYRHIDLSHCTVDQVISWNSHTTNRPDLARLVCALTLPWELTCGEHEHHAIFNHRDPIGDLTALESMDNLKSLFIVCPSRKHGPIIYRWPRTVHLMGGTFRLKTFRCLDWRKVRMNTLAPFLLKQSQIRDLEIGQQSFEISSSPANLPIANLLPHLSVLSTSYNSRSCTILMSCHLRRLKLEMPHAGLIHVTSAFGMLEMAPASVTLTHLHLDFSPGSQIREDDHAEVLMNISKALPNLRFLRYSDPNAFNSSSSEWQAFPRTLSSFKNLQTLGLDFEHYGGGPKSPRFHALASLCMASCVTLHCVKITAMNTTRCDPHISLIRAPDLDSGIQISDFQPLEESAWRDI